VYTISNFGAVDRFHEIYYEYFGAGVNANIVLLGFLQLEKDVANR
jgi:hypothetical protein